MENIALGDASTGLHDPWMSGALDVAVARQGRVSRLSQVTCTLGRRDKPFPESHESATWTVALVRRGTFRYRAAASNRTHEFRPGWLLVGLPDAVFECSHDHDDGDDCASLALAEDVLLDTAKAAGVPIQKLLSSAPALPPLPRAAALLERARVHDQADLDEVGYLVAEAVVAHASGTPIREAPRHPSHLARVQAAMDRIESSCRDPISLAELADSVDLSPFHFLRVFRRVTGTTPHQYLIGARLRLAAQMLLDTDRAITEIAYDVGFQDLSNFIRTFHRVIGCAPSAYRRL